MNLNTTEITFSSTDESADVDTDEGDDGPTVVNMDEQIEFSAGRYLSDSIDLDGFNEHGIRENRNDDGDLESVDVVFEAMEPGPPEERNGLRITSEFLQEVAGKDYSKGEPYMLGHSDQPLDEVGKLKEVMYSEQVDKLLVMNRVFNTGAQTHDEVINRLTHNPPTMTDGSVGFGNNYTAAVNADGEPELIDGKIREFSSVPFPGGYEDGGVGIPDAAFAERVLDKADAEFDDGANVTESPENLASANTETISF